MRLIKKQIDFDQVFEKACAQNGIILDKENASDRSVKIIDEQGKAVIVNSASDILSIKAEIAKSRPTVKSGVRRRIASKTVEEQNNARVRRRKQMSELRKARKKHIKKVH